MNHYVNETEIYPVFPSTVTTSLPEAVHPKCVIRGVILKCPGIISSDPFRWVLFAMFSFSSPTRAAQTALCNYIEQRNKQKIFQTWL